MQFDHLSRKHPRLQGLLAQSAHFRRLDTEVKKLLPANLAAHCRVVRVDEQGQLVLFASGNMAAGRLRMILPALLPRLQNLDETITGVVCKVMPPNEPPRPPKTLFIPEQALARFDETAERLAHHQGLAQALRDLVRNHRNQAD
ncbi:DciA family protein [Conchiformibius kuhniae]|uniref:DciA family protein n=1 Tax=Conchiformibius kuhniae TaxID=211502 RepID=A0A8T9MST5_9NEIS|nr:DciA family protein [Conchiformibius kuhniae]UOP04667.1 DUF721 domain-containing protein [Conchiformibius kuhniae]